MPHPYVADTNIYVMAANDPAFRERFEVFIREHGPLLVSTVVIAEVLIGIADPARHHTAVRSLSAGTTPAAPSADDWFQAGAAIAQLGGEAVTKSCSFWNDTLLAAQCARLGATLITRNSDDFRRLGRRIAVQAIPPFP